MQYATFISYNHRDRKWASWLHRALEAYRVPRRLRGRETVLGPLGSRLPPIFQDREELAASSDLAASVREALAASSSLIVICSPAAAQSRWVNEEIRTFSGLGGRDRIQCLIVGGEPNASRIEGLDPTLECLPPALFETGGGEPLASDVRPGQDRRSSAKLKLLAGIMGIGYDELRQREQARRQKRLAVVAAASAIGFIVMSALAGFALVSRKDALEQRDLARQKTLTAERTVEFVKSMFEVADPSEARGSTITAREVLDRGALRIDRELQDEPTVKAELGTTLGEVYTGLGLFKTGDALLQRMLAIPSVDAGTRARLYLALAEARVWQADDPGAIAAFRKALELARDPRTGRSDLLPRILAGLGEEQALVGDVGQGERNVRAALAADRAAGEARIIDVARDYEALGNLLFAAGRLDESRDAFSRGLRIRLQRQGDLHPRTIQDLNQLGSVAYMQKDTKAAEAYFRRMLPLQERVLGPKHPEVAGSLNNVARMMIERRAYAPAVPLLRRAVGVQIAQRGAATDELVFPLSNLGIALRGSGDLAGAAAAFERALMIATATAHRNLGPLLADRADLACSSGDTGRGRRLVAQSRPVMAKSYPGDAWRLAWVDAVEGGCLIAGGTPKEGRLLLARAAPAIEARWPVGSHYRTRFSELAVAAKQSPGR